MATVKEGFPDLGEGWVADYPDARDFSVRDSIDHADWLQANPLSQFEFADRFPPASPCQASLSVSASVCGELLDYYCREFESEQEAASKWFLHHLAPAYSACNVAGRSIRSIFKAVVRAGVPPERFEKSCSPHDPAFIDNPVLFTYRNIAKGIVYLRVDCSDVNMTLRTVKSLLAAGQPMVFGFSVPKSISADPRVDRYKTDAVQSLSAGIFVGYDDDFRVQQKGALKFRSCWGSDWGDQGYGWLSYNLVKEGQIRDIWTIWKPEWSETA